jgi:hypothetical protein
VSEITRVGVDLAKNLIQVHAVDVAGKVIANRAISDKLSFHAGSVSDPFQ